MTGTYKVIKPYLARGVFVLDAAGRAYQIVDGVCDCADAGCPHGAVAACAPELGAGEGVLITDGVCGPVLRPPLFR